MLRVGLTGGIGSGKSTVAAALRDRGSVIIDADVLAREVVEPGTDGLAAVAQRFGTDLVGADGSLDRAALGRVVFGDEVARRDLEAILHPRIAARTREVMVAAPRDAIVVHDVPLLVEKAMGAAYHLVVVVGADGQTRVDRLMRDRGMSAEEAQARIAAQATDEQRRAAADVWLDNSGSRDTVMVAVDNLWAQRLVPYNAHLAAGEPVRDVEATAYEISPEDRPAAVARLTGRVRHAFGDVARRVSERASSSAAPAAGVDLRVDIGAITDLSGSVVAQRLADAGFIHDSQAGRAGDPIGEATFLGCDPGLVTRLHVFGQPEALAAP